MLLVKGYNVEKGEICPRVWKIWLTGVAGQEEIFETQS